jgi:hypothetical protein
MKRIGLFGIGILFLVLGSIAPIYALQEQHEQESKAPKQEQQAKPERQQQQKAPQQAKTQEKPQKQPQQAKPERQQQKAPQQAKAPQQQQKAPQQAKRAPQAKPAEKQQVKQTEPTQRQKTQQSRVNGGNSRGGAHGRISDDHYRASFGDSHRFHVSEGDFRNHRFQYGGYSFGFVDPWPAGWLYTDDVYVEYIDGGYYMFDAFHPGIRISLNIF